MAAIECSDILFWHSISQDHTIYYVISCTVCCFINTNIDAHTYVHSYCTTGLCIFLLQCWMKAPYSWNLCISVQLLSPSPCISVHNTNTTLCMAFCFWSWHHWFNCVNLISVTWLEWYRRYELQPLVCICVYRVQTYRHTVGRCTCPLFTTLAVISWQHGWVSSILLSTTCKAKYAAVVATRMSLSVCWCDVIYYIFSAHKSVHKWVPVRPLLDKLCVYLSKCVLYVSDVHARIGAWCGRCSSMVGLCRQAWFNSMWWCE